MYYADATGQLTVAEDSGLEIDALDGQPGIESARWGGAEATYPEKFAILYEALRAKGAVDSPARFVCALALVHGGEVLFETRGTVEGRIAREPKGDGGFGYDPIFFYPPLGRTLAEADDAKAAISHRGRHFGGCASFCHWQPRRPIESAWAFVDAGLQHALVQAGRALAHAAR